MKCCIVLLVAVVCVGGTELRDPRWFNRPGKTITKVVTEKRVVTEATPSSCVVVQTALPPCRHLRALPIQPSQPGWVRATQAPALALGGMDGQGWSPIQATEPLSPAAQVKLKDSATTEPTPSEWNWDIFNLGGRQDITVTQTVQQVFTSRYLDPNTVVTFSVKGCRPSRLPFDLPECKTPEKAEQQNRNVIVMAPVRFVQSMSDIYPSPSMSPVAADIPPVEPEKAEVAQEEKKN